MKTEPKRLSLGNIHHAFQAKRFDLEPPYQREGFAWNLSRKQYFIDSLLNGYDIPKLYVRDILGKKGTYQYAVIDGKQRLIAVRGFLDNEYVLDSDFSFSQDALHVIGNQIKNEACREKLYKDLPLDVQTYLRDVGLDLVVVTTDDEEDIEELFSRLNNGVPLNGAEKRNAMAGDFVSLIREIASASPFVLTRVRVHNKKYAHYEIAAKMLLTEHQGRVTDLKSKFLDEIATNLRHMGTSDRKKLKAAVMARLHSLSKIFGKRDPLLSKQAYIPLYYLFERSISSEYVYEDVHKKLKSFLESFEKDRRLNARKDADEADPELTNYTRSMQQGTNDEGSLRVRLGVLTRGFLTTYPKYETRDPNRVFNEDEKYILWIRAKKKCEDCGGEIDFKDVQAHHVTPFAKGGKTVLSNGMCLCSSCHSKKHAPHVVS